jgi:hypothetical protein
MGFMVPFDPYAALATGDGGVRPRFVFVSYHRETNGSIVARPLYGRGPREHKKKEHRTWGRFGRAGGKLVFGLNANYSQVHQRNESLLTNSVVFKDQ